MNATSAVSIAFDPLLGWPVLAVLGGIGLVLVAFGVRRRARHDVAPGLAGGRAGRA